MPSNVWASFKPPEWVDGEAFAYFGADPVWTPAKEARRETDPDGAPGKCYLCGGEGWVEIDGEEYLMEVAIEDGDPAVCSRCGRYGRQYLIDNRPLPAAMAPKEEARPEAEKSAPPEILAVDLPIPSALTSRAVVVCDKHPDCVRRGDAHVPAKYAAMLAEA